MRNTMEMVTVKCVCCGDGFRAPYHDGIEDEALYCATCTGSDGDDDDEPTNICFVARGRDTWNDNAVVVVTARSTGEAVDRLLNEHPLFHDLRGVTVRPSGRTARVQ